MHLHGIVRLKDTESGANISMNNLLLRSKESKRQHSWPVAVSQILHGSIFKVLVLLFNLVLVTIPVAWKIFQT